MQAGCALLLLKNVLYLAIEEYRHTSDTVLFLEAGYSFFSGRVVSAVEVSEKTMFCC